MRRAACAGNNYAQATLARFSAYLKSQSGVRCALTIRASCGILRALQDLHGRGEHFVVALAAHHHAYQRLFAHGVIIRGRVRTAATEPVRPC